MGAGQVAAITRREQINPADKINADHPVDRDGPHNDGTCTVASQAAVAGYAA